MLVILGSFAFVLAGVALWRWAEPRGPLDVVQIRGVAVVAAVCFGGCGLYGCVKLSDPSPGLVLDRDGIPDNSSAVAVGRIPWADVTGVRVSAEGGQRFLTIDVAHPGKYLARGGRLSRLANAANARTYGSPVNIAATALAVPFDDLHRLVVEAFERHGRRGVVAPGARG